MDAGAAAIARRGQAVSHAACRARSDCRAERVRAAASSTHSSTLAQP